MKKGRPRAARLQLTDFPGRKHVSARQKLVILARPRADISPNRISELKVHLPRAF